MVAQADFYPEGHGTAGERAGTGILVPIVSKHIGSLLHEEAHQCGHDTGVEDVVAQALAVKLTAVARARRSFDLRPRMPVESCQLNRA